MINNTVEDAEKINAILTQNLHLICFKTTGFATLETSFSKIIQNLYSVVRHYYCSGKKMASPRNQIHIDCPLPLN